MIRGFMIVIRSNNSFGVISKYILVCNTYLQSYIKQSVVSDPSAFCMVFGWIRVWKKSDLDLDPIRIRYKSPNSRFQMLLFGNISFTKVNYTFFFFSRLEFGSGSTPTG